MGGKMLPENWMTHNNGRVFHIVAFKVVMSTVVVNKFARKIST